MTDRRIAIALFLLALVPYCYFYGGWGANQEASYALTRAVVEARTFQVDNFTVREGDIAFGQGGHVYINKPPGLSALAVPPYALLYALQQRGVLTFRDAWRTDKQIVTVAVCGVGGALIAPILYLYGRRRLGVSRRSAAVAVMAIAFGTMLFPYSTMLFAHVPSALFLLLALVLLPERPLLAGVAAGLAGACFMLSAIAALALVGLAWWYSARKALLFLGGGVPFAAALAVYQWICFGSPTITPVERSTAFIEKGLLLGVFGRFDPMRLRAITISEYRGLFYCSPVLLLALAGAVLMFRRRRFRAELLAIAAIALFFILSISCFNGWHGGAAFGPRYLMPIIPLLAIPMMFAAGRLRALWLVAGMAGLAMNLAATSVDPMPLDGLTRPLTGYIFPTLLTHRVPPATRAFLYPDCKSARCTPNKVSLAQDAKNLGEPLLGVGRASTIVPAALWIIGGCWCLLAVVAREDRIREPDCSSS